MSDLSGIKILIVDDEEALRDILVDELECEGASAEAAENGQKALEMLAQKTYDFVISDVRMPVMDGIELLKQICQKYGEIRPKVLLLSGYTDLNPDEAIKLGALDLMEKPWNMDVLIQKIQSNR